MEQFQNIWLLKSSPKSPPGNESETTETAKQGWNWS